MMAVALAALALLATLWLARISAVLRLRGAARPAGSPPIRTMVVLGSGGHTSEMLSLVGSIDRAKYAPLLYVLARSDSTSLHRVEAAERARARPAEGSQSAAGGPCEVLRVPRSREVAQSYLTSVFTTLYALSTSFAILLRTRPSLLICNGPGTCIPICLAAFALRLLGIKYVTIIYVESVCRVRSLSMSGKIMIHLADKFLVQWPQLASRFPKSTYVGRVC
ncbi:hypothetical protein AB1Y20_002672 [Prymnesium parvum]|uniref:UDP-N-acetylglucosamine transferase subunit ALG14 n=1 Tax=Prymnesium parvum TaxID=97485 RepID=A0AB34JC88_PRYPA